MACVRMAIVLVVAFLLVRPVLVSEDRGRGRGRSSVLIDVSQSMDSRDPRPSAADQWRAAIAFGVIDPDRASRASRPDLVHEREDPRPPASASRSPARRSPTRRLGLFPRLVHATGPLDVFTFGIQRTGKSWAETAGSRTSRPRSREPLWSRARST